MSPTSYRTALSRVDIRIVTHDPPDVKPFSKTGDKSDKSFIIRERCRLALSRLTGCSETETDAEDGYGYPEGSTHDAVSIGSFTLARAEVLCRSKKTAILRKAPTLCQETSYLSINNRCLQEFLPFAACNQYCQYTRNMI